MVFKDDPNYNNQQKLIVETYMKLSEMRRKINEGGMGEVDQLYSNSEGMVNVIMAKKALFEREKFDIVKYYIHYQTLQDYQKELMNFAIETNHSAFDVKVVAKF